MPTNYQRGRAFEYKTRDALYERGAVYVMRAAQSKGAADLIALWPYAPGRRHWIVQCKFSINGVARVPPVERRKLIALAQEAGCFAYAAVPGKNNRGVKFICLSGGSDDRTGREEGAPQGASAGSSDHPADHGVSG